MAIRPRGSRATLQGRCALLPHLGRAAGRYTQRFRLNSQNIPAGIAIIAASTSGTATRGGRISRFIPKKPAMKFSGRKIVAMSDEPGAHRGEPVVRVREVRVHRRREQVAAGVDLLGEPDRVVDHVAEVDRGLVPHERLARARQRGEDLALRREPLAEQRVARGAPRRSGRAGRRRPRRRRCASLVGELLHVRGQRVHQREVDVGHGVVDQVEREVRRRGRGAPARPRSARRPRPPRRSARRGR